MAGLNEVKLIGHLGKDPELRNMTNGDTVASFSLATSEQWKDKVTGEKKSRTEWHNIVVWGPLATICGKYLHKGSQIYVSGQLRTRMWEKDTVKHYITEVFMKDMLMLGTNPNNQNATKPDANTPGSNAHTQTDTTAGTDDLPF